MISFSPDLYVGLPLADILQPDILVQEVTGEDRMRERLTLLSQEKEEKGTMVTVTTVLSPTNQNTTFKGLSYFFQHHSIKLLIYFERNIFYITVTFLRCKPGPYVECQTRRLVS